MAALGGLGEHFRSFAIVFTKGISPVVQGTYAMEGRIHTLFCSSITPLQSKPIVLSYPNSFLVCDAQVGFSWCIVLFCSFTVPEHCLSFIEWHTSTVVIHLAELVLGGRPALFCRFAIPPHRFDIVFLNATTFLVEHRQRVLRFLISVLSFSEKIDLRC